MNKNLSEYLRSNNEHSSVLNTDMFDRRRFDELVEMSDELKLLSEEEPPPMFKELLGDIWASFYKTNPSLSSVGDLNKGLSANHRFMIKVMNQDFYHQHKPKSELNDTLSVLGTMEMGEATLDWFDEQIENNQKLQEQMDQMEELVQQIQNEQRKEQMENNAENNNGDGQEQQETNGSNSELNQEEQGSGQQENSMDGIGQEADNDVSRENTSSSNDGNFGDNQRSENGELSDGDSDEQNNQGEKSNSEALAEQLDELMEEFGRSMQDSLDENGDNLAQMLSDALEEADKTNNQLEDLFGGRSKGSAKSDLEKIPLRDKLRLAEIIRDDVQLKRIADWAGRFKRIARKKDKSHFKEGVGRAGVTMGDDLTNVLPSEMFLYFDERTKGDFLKRFREKKLLQYETSGKKNLGKGSIIFVIDQSSSMKHLEEQSKAFGLALMSIARRQKRNFIYIPFSFGVGRIHQFKKGKIKPDDMINLAKEFMGGGTNFTSPLSDAIRLIKQDRYKDADIVFVTDGQDSVTPRFINEFMKEKKKLEFSVMSLVIGKDSSANTVHSFSDKVMRISSFNEDGAFEAFEI